VEAKLKESIWFQIRERHSNCCIYR